MAEDKNIKQQYLNFDEYIRQGEPEKKERAEAWRVAIGLQPFIVPFSKVCLSMQAVSAIMTSRRKSGCCETILCSMDAGKTFK